MCSIKEGGVGDWVRFYNGGELVIGQVEYIVKDRYTFGYSLSTTAGGISLDYVLEVRKRNDG